MTVCGCDARVLRARKFHDRSCFFEGAWGELKVTRTRRLGNPRYRREANLPATPFMGHRPSLHFSPPHVVRSAPAREGGPTSASTGNDKRNTLSARLSGLTPTTPGVVGPVGGFRTGR